MRSLFEKEEKEIALNQLKLDLISRFYPFSKDEILQYKSILNFDRYHLMNNDLVKWDIEFFEKVDSKIDWTALFKIKNIKYDLAFFKKYKSKIEFSSIQFSKNIEWSNDLLSEYGDMFDWSNWLITKEPLSTIDNLRRFKDILDWRFVSKRINIEFTDEILEDFSEKWDWRMLSTNKYLPISVEFIKKYMKKLDFDALSENPKCIDLILKYPKTKKWNWNNVILNPAISYNKDSFNFVFRYYKKQYENKKFENPFFKGMALHSFLYRLFIRNKNESNYFLQDDFINYLPWNIISQNYNTKLTLEFIEKYKHKLNFKESNLLRLNINNITKDFVESNIDLFDTTKSSFYNLPLTFEMLNKLNMQNDKSIWLAISNNEKLDWTWENIDTYYDKLNFFFLSKNKGIYEKLIINEYSNKGIIEFLNSKIT